ncbi:Nucleolar protein of 40 kDa [Mactra antiquata]
MSKRKYDDERAQEPKRRKDFGPIPDLYAVFRGEVAAVKEYGIFVKIPDTSRQGLVHKSQISRTKVDDPSEMFAKGEIVHCKVISLNDNGEKIGLAMKTVNQTTGQDQDPNNVELSQDEKKRKQFGNRSERQKIVLEAVLDTTCKKCGGKGHLAQDCFMSGSSSYDLIPDLDEYMQNVGNTDTLHKSSKHQKKEKKKSKKKKEKKSKQKKKRKYSSSSESDSSPDRSKSKKKKKRKKHRDTSSSDSSDSDYKHKKSKKRERHRRSSSSSSES